MRNRAMLSVMVLFVLLAALMTASTCLAAEPSLKALIIDGQNNHAWAQTTPPLKKLLEETGLFTVDVATTPPRGGDMSTFKPDFEKYDVVVANYTGDSWSEETKAAFEKYMENGGGLVVYHAADNAFRDWKAWMEMIAIGGWGGRNETDGPYLYWKDGEIVRDTTPGRAGSHGPQHPFAVDIRVADHPITEGLPASFMHCADELYSLLRGPAKNVTVLATSYAPEEKRGSGRHEPSLMVIQYGKGRVFHTTLGHATEQLKSVAFIVTFQRGTEWAATGEVTQPIPDDMPGADEPVMRD